MTFSRKSLVAAAALTIGILTVTDTAEACKRGRGGYRGYSRGYSSYGYGGYRRTYPSYGSPAPIQSAPPQQFAPQQPISQQPISQQPISQQPISQQPPQQFPQQPIAQQPQQQPQQQFAPQQQPIAQNPTPQQSTPQQPAPTQPNNAQNSALQALGGFAPPQQTPTQTPAPTMAGTWTASLGNGAKVQLTLQTDGTFSWTATNAQGTPSSFSGRYTLGNGSLTLIRGNDNQQLAGNLSNTSANGFSFKVSGQNTAAINFSRA